MLYTIFPFSAARDIYYYYIIFRSTQISSNQSFVFSIFIPRSSILTIKTRSLCGSLFFLIKCISAYLLGVNCVPCLLAHIMHRLCAAVSLLQLSAVLPSQVIKLVLLINLKLSMSFLIFLKCFNSFKKEKKNRR